MKVKEEKLIVSGIYQIRNLVNGLVYVGKSKNMLNRRCQHFQQLDADIHINRYLQEEYNKFGKDNFSFEILEYCNIDMFLSDKEQLWIDKKQSYRREKGYNILQFSEFRDNVEFMQKIEKIKNRKKYVNRSKNLLIQKCLKAGEDVLGEWCINSNTGENYFKPELNKYWINQYNREKQKVGKELMEYRKYRERLKKEEVILKENYEKGYRRK